MGFLDEDYLLVSNKAKELYEAIKDLPIVDPHNHADIKEIVFDAPWADIWQIEGATDHYVWELMRKRGIPEEKITGNAPNREKWLALSEIFSELVGNPVYEWIHLDFKRVFGIEDIISAHTGEKIWEETLSVLKRGEITPQKVLRRMNVKILSTTDDPTDSLEFHEKASTIEGIKITPTWRPDKAMNIEKEEWKRYVKKLGDVTRIDTFRFDGFLDALGKTHEKFDIHGCVASDHGIERPITFHVDKERAASIFEKRLKGERLKNEEVITFKAFMLCEFGKMNEDARWVMQLHIGAVRDYRDKLYNTLGPDSGGDISTNALDIAGNLRYFLNRFDGKLKIILYVLDPTHLPTIATIARAFPNVSLGAAWWFNDSPFGMEMHLKYIATVDLLYNFAGMVTDSRKLLSYGSRTEMFRRVFSSVVGEMVDRGQIPLKEGMSLVEQVSYYRPYEFFYGRKTDFP